VQILCRLAVRQAGSAGAEAPLPAAAAVRRIERVRVSSRPRRAQPAVQFLIAGAAHVTIGLMAVRAVAFDIGGVLEVVAPEGQITGRWAQRLGMSEAELEAAVALVDPGGVMPTGGLTEAEIKKQYATALGLSGRQADEFMADLWDWYCGDLDDELASYASRLRPRYRTGILSNSADGARREEQARYGFQERFDVIIYSHEAGLAKPDPRAYALLCSRLNVTPDELVFLDDAPGNIDAACQLGIHGVLHRSASESIEAISILLA
jgi:putative hydrolase of the HAD superfamily